MNFKRNSYFSLIISNFNILISDRESDCLAFELLGEYDELFFNESGESQSRNWRTTGTSFVTRYPRAWERYLTRPVGYLQHGSGEF